MKTKEQLGEEILECLRGAEGLLDMDSSLHYGQNVFVLKMSSEQGKAHGHGFYAAALDLRSKILAYRVACTPEPPQRVAAAMELRARAAELREKARGLLEGIPSDAIDALAPKEKKE